MTNFVKLDGICLDTTLKDIVSCFQLPSSIEISLKRPLNPDSLGVTLTFETPATFDKFKKQLTGGEIKIPCIYPEPPQPIEYRMLTESKDRLNPTLFSQFQNFMRHRNEFQQFMAEKEEKLRQEKIKLEQKQTQSLDDLISSTRREVDYKGQNEGELPVGANGNFHENDIRRICRVCNIEVNSISNFESHRKGKKHMKKQADFDRTGQYEKSLQLIIAKGEALWQKQEAKNGGNKPVPQSSMQHFTQQIIARLPIHRLCPVCNIELSSPIVALSHYKGVKHVKKEQQNNIDPETRSKIAEFVSEGGKIEGEAWSNAGFNRRMHDNRHERRMREQRQDKKKAWDARSEIERKRKLPPRQSMDVVEDGRVKQRRALGRIFNEPNPIEGNLSDGEIVEQGEEEVIFPITRKTPKLHMDSVENGRILETADF